MKAVAYSIMPHERESLILANGKKHSLTLISNELNDNTLVYAYGKETIIVSAGDRLDQHTLLDLQRQGVRYIITRSVDTAHIDLAMATQLGFKIANVPGEDLSAERISRAVIRNLDAWERGRCVGSACCCHKTSSVIEKKD